MRFLFLLILLPVFVCGQTDELYKENRTYTHSEVILKYGRLEKEHPDMCRLIKGGITDCGRNLHLFVVSKNGQFDPEKIDRKKTAIIFVNNAIHPGEPCGVDASLKLAREFLRSPEKLSENVVICIVPIYNIGGATNRNCCSRANQNGPVEYGFRGNARNLDLNRDFVKMDSRNAWSFVAFYRQWDPDILVDTHTSNGADYQHVMTLITTQPDKLNATLSDYVVNRIRPALYHRMKEQNYPMCPYVHGIKETPDHGLIDYLETPRYSTGYAATFNTIGFVTEAHMLKPYEQRVEATYFFLKELYDFTCKNSTELLDKRALAKKQTGSAGHFNFNFQLDTTVCDTIEFLGYEAKYKTSEVSGLYRLYYDRNTPYTKKVRYFCHYNPDIQIKKPKYYVVPQAWREVTERFQANNINMIRIESDTDMVVQAYYIKSYETLDRPFEGHYLHNNVEVSQKDILVSLYRGDYLIPMGHESDRFVMETLEPQAVDSYFAWNFFDEILQQKEWFSAYVFEEVAAGLLQSDPDLRAELEAKKANDPEFAKNGWAQLYFVYTHSDYYENSHNRYPIYRVN